MGLARGGDWGAWLILWCLRLVTETQWKPLFLARQNYAFISNPLINPAMEKTELAHRELIEKVWHLCHTFSKSTGRRPLGHPAPCVGGRWLNGRSHWVPPDWREGPSPQSCKQNPIHCKPWAFLWIVLCSEKARAVPRSLQNVRAVTPKVTELLLPSGSAEQGKVSVSVSQGLLNIHNPGSFLTDENVLQTEPGPVFRLAPSPAKCRVRGWQRRC